MALSNGGDDFDEGEDTPIQIQMRKIGKRGGRRTAKVHGSQHFVRIGQFGGIATRDKLGPEWFAEIGRKGGIARAKRRAESQSS